jgi:hypothetical protein
MCRWVVLPFCYVISKFYIVHKVGYVINMCRWVELPFYYVIFNFYIVHKVGYVINMCRWVVLPFYYVISKIYIVHKIGWIPTNRSPSQFFTAMGICYSDLFSYPDILFFIPCKRIQSLRDQRAQQTPEGLNQSTEKEEFFYFFFLGMWVRMFFSFWKFWKILS